MRFHSLRSHNLRSYGLSHYLVSLGILLASFTALPSKSFANELGIDPIITGNVSSQGAKQAKAKLGASGLPLPRFASLKANRVNLRIGPGREHAIAMRYLKAGLPVEIVREWSNWRQIRDWEGTQGWVHGSLLSGKRAAIVSPWAKGSTELIALKAKPNTDSRAIAKMEAGTSAKIEKCADQWCAIEIGKRKGWIEQDMLWGVYGSEVIDD